MFEVATLEDALKLLGALLRDRGEHFDVVAIGGGGLQLLGFIQRPTKDIDLVAIRDGAALLPASRPLPQPLADAITDVARVQGLDDHWMNGGPTSQIHFKLFAAADDRPNGKHHADLLKLEPTHDELRAAARWAQTHDPSEGFALMLDGVLRSFGIS